jgi:hypothetical protein
VEGVRRQDGEPVRIVAGRAAVQLLGGAPLDRRAELLEGVVQDLAGRLDRGIRHVS